MHGEVFIRPHSIAVKKLSTSWGNKFKKGWEYIVLAVQKDLSASSTRHKMKHLLLRKLNQAEGKRVTTLHLAEMGA